MQDPPYGMPSWFMDPATVVVRLRPPHAWHAQDLKGTVVKLMQRFLAATSQRGPKHVVFMRDGISEGQFSKVPLSSYTARFAYLSMLSLSCMMLLPCLATCSLSPLRGCFRPVWPYHFVAGRVLQPVRWLVLCCLFIASSNSLEREKLCWWLPCGLTEAVAGLPVQAQAYEIPQIAAGLQEVLGERVPLTYVVVQKRHNTRLFPNDPRASDRNGNVLPGGSSVAAVPWSGCRNAAPCRVKLGLWYRRYTCTP